MRVKKSEAAERLQPTHAAGRKAACVCADLAASPTVFCCDTRTQIFKPQLAMLTVTCSLRLNDRNLAEAVRFLAGRECPQPLLSCRFNPES